MLKIIFNFDLNAENIYGYINICYQIDLQQKEKSDKKERLFSED